MSEDILVLGATGSIGLQTIDVCKKQNNFHIVGVSIYSNIEVLIENLKDLPFLKYIAVIDKSKGEELKSKYPKYTYFIGNNANIELLDLAKYTKVVNSIVGFSGLLPSIKCLSLNKALCLANKESLVIGGKFIKEILNQGKGKLFPIDSEHVALAKLLKNVNRSEIKKMIITASGGSLRDIDVSNYDKVQVKDVLNHPTWKMGHRITIDSATMVNKGLEFIEASYLFDFDINQIDVLINDESRIHSALLFKDNSYLFEVGPSDMRIPISYALNETKRVEMDYKSVDFNSKCSLNFRKFDENKYPLFNLVLETFKLGDTSMAFFNAVDEEIIKYFVKGQIIFLEMINFIKDIVSKDMILIKNCTIDDLVLVDKKAREIVNNRLNNYLNKRI